MIRTNHLDHDRRKCDLEEQLAILENDHRRLQWLYSSVFADETIRERTGKDIASVEEDLRRVRVELMSLETNQ